MNSTAMLTVEKARETVLEHVAPLPKTSIAIGDALDHVTAEDVVAKNSSPPFDNSAMDGFAVRSREVGAAGSNSPVKLTVAATVHAGDAPLAEFPQASAVRIMTGAALPQGADSVVPFEHTAEYDDGGVVFNRPVAVGAYVRKKGNDFADSAVLVKKGELLTPPKIGLLVAAGVAEVTVHPRPRVALISGGNELSKIGAPLRPGSIYDCNGPMLAAAVRKQGGKVVEERRLRDDFDDTAEAIRECAELCDLIISSGGVSVGDRDFLRAAAQKIVFWRVAMRPGRQFMFALSGTKPPAPFFGLPGNPVSSLVTFEQFVRPTIRKMRGMASGKLKRVTAVSKGAIVSEKGLQTYSRVSLTTKKGVRYAIPEDNQSSAALLSQSRATGWAVCPPKVVKIESGTEVQVELFLEDSGE